MPATLTYPGVYIEEVPSGVRTITGVATSITAFVGSAERGPLDEPILINSNGDYERIFGGLSNDSSLGFAIRDFYLNGGSQAIVVRVNKGGTAATFALATGGAVPNDSLALQAANPGKWGNALSVTVDTATKDPADNKLFNLTVVEKNPITQQVVQTEKFLNVSIDPNDARYVPAVLEHQSRLVRGVRNGGNWIVPNVRPNAATAAAAANSGTSGTALTSAEFNGPGLENAKKGIYALRKADLFNILCIPPYKADGNVDTTVITDAAVYCEKRRAFLLVDPPSGWGDKDAAKIGIAAGVGTTSKNAALFFPRLTKPNPVNDNQPEDFAPCGAIAGIFARTDTNRGVWKAPAGLEATLVGVPQLSVPLTDAENGELNPLGVNCLRSLPPVGRVAWGSRTLQGDDRFASEWKYIPIRRTALFIEESLYRGTQWVVFEPNDEPLWAQIRLNVGAFMNGLFRQGAFQGTTPRDAYFVKCDKESNPQNDVDRGIVNIIVGFAPLKPAEFVVIKLQQIAGQIQT
jgi:Bacteriophage tail sheath protein